MALELAWPSAEYLPSYAAALARGWSPDTVRPEAADEELNLVKKSIEHVDVLPRLRTAIPAGAAAAAS